MTSEEKRDAAINQVAQLLKVNPFSMEFKVVKKPKGIKIIYEVTQEEMNKLLQMQRERRK